MKRHQLTSQTRLHVIDDALGTRIIMMWNNTPEVVVCYECGAAWHWVGGESWNCPNCIKNKLNSIRKD